MCSSPKSSSVTSVKKVSTSPLSNRELNNFVAIANASDARREERERIERERLASEAAMSAAMSNATENTHGIDVQANYPDSHSFLRVLHSVHTALTAKRSWGVTG